MSFELLLAEDRVKPHQVTALHLIVGFVLLGCGGLLLMTDLTLKYMPFTYDEQAASLSYETTFTWLGWGMLITGLFLLAVTMFRNKWVTRPVNNKIFRALELTAVTGLVIFAGMHMLWVPGILAGLLAVVLALALIWEDGKKNKLSVIIDEKGIKVPSAIKRGFIFWPEVEQVILRHGVLTINCCDNRMYQWNVRHTGFNYDDFEAFCSSQIEVNKDKRNAYNW